MKIIPVFAAALLALSLPSLGRSAEGTPYAVPQVDAPALAALGPHAIGTRRIAITSPDHAMLTPQGLVRGPRTIWARVWYPSAAQPGATAVSYTHTLPKIGGSGVVFSIPGLAVENAAVVAAGRLPLVIVSHGYSGWDSFTTWLTENLATKGYVVVAIDHDDAPFASAAGFFQSFNNVLINRAQDQRDVIGYFATLAAKRDDALGKVIDADRVGIIGYSMGGYGALATSGADYDLDSPPLQRLPVEARAAILASQTKGTGIAARIKALVTIAPWGGQPTTRVWTAASLAKLAKPVLVIDGSADDVADYKQGVSWIYGQLTGSDRRLLVFQNALHNVGGNPAPAATKSDFSSHEYFADPVWRTERINAVNQHFITAFLDLSLKGDAAKAAYLNVPVASGNEAVWPTAFGENVGARTASDKETGYWRGFQRRTTLGLEMHHDAVAALRR